LSGAGKDIKGIGRSGVVKDSVKSGGVEVLALSKVISVDVANVGSRRVTKIGPRELIVDGVGRVRIPGGDVLVLGGINQFDKMGVGISSVVPVVGVNVVGGVTIRITKTSLEQLHFSSGQTSQLVPAGKHGKSGGNTGTKIGNVVSLLTVETVGVDEPVQSRSGFVSVKGGAGTIQVLGDLHLVKSSRVGREGNGVLGPNSDIRVEGLVDITTIIRSDIISTPVEASHAAGGDNVVGEVLEGGTKVIARSININRVGGPLVTNGIRKDNSVGTGDGGRGGGVDGIGPVGVTDVLDSVIVLGISTVLADLLLTVSSLVPTIADTSHGRILVPKSVKIVVVAS
jgi:hypothetical protein